MNSVMASFLQGAVAVNEIPKLIGMKAFESCCEGVLHVTQVNQIFILTPLGLKSLSVIIAINSVKSSGSTAVLLRGLTSVSSLLRSWIITTNLYRL